MKDQVSVTIFSLRGARKEKQGVTATAPTTPSKGRETFCDKSTKKDKNETHLE